MTRTWSEKRGVWFAQGFVAVILALFVSRIALRTEKAPGGSGGRPGTRTSAASRPASSLPSDRPSLAGPARSVPQASPDPLQARSSPLPVPASGTNSGYAPDQYRTQLLRDEKSYQVWGLDPREGTWLLAHRRQILTSDLETRSEPGGGLRVLRIRELSFGSARGLKVGDILKDINGQSLDTSFDLEDLIEDPAYSGSKGWRVALERDGKPLTIDYQPASGTPTTHREH